MSLFGFNPHGDVQISGLAGPKRSSQNGDSDSLFILTGTKPEDKGPQKPAVSAVSAVAVAEEPERNHWDSSDEEVDEFGRKKKRLRGAVGAALKKAKGAKSDECKTKSSTTAVRQDASDRSDSYPRPVEKEKKNGVPEDST